MTAALPVGRLRGGALAHRILRAARPQTGAILRHGAALLALFLFCLSHYLNRSFGRPDFDQIAYHLSYGLDLASDADPVLVRRFVRWCVLAPPAIWGVIVWAERRWGAALAGRWRAALQAWPPALLLAALLYWALQLSLLSHIAAAYGTDYFSANYVPPETIALRVERPKNLVLIYVESLESSYARPALFGKNLLAPLDALGGTSFEAYRQAPGTGWTIAAIVATQCGVPLKRVSVFDGNRQGELLKSFLPNATCLGDLLSAHGYRNVFMAGAAARFAGKEKFLHDHHYDAILGKEDWLREGVRADEMNGWGLYDVALLARARQQVRQLEAAGRPYNLTLLTVDTHEPAGHLSRSCAQRGLREFEGVIECSAQDVAGLVRYMKENGYLAHTNVVILGDHLSRRNPVTDKLPPLAERHIYNAFISEQDLRKNTEQITHFDLLPTILTMSGFEFAGGRLGLGYSAFGRQPQA
ncbi:MAG: sulfatase-like hydrolase/transferase, partial [Massilia sp.]